MTDITADNALFEPATKPANNTNLRRRLLLGLAVGLVAAGLGYGGYEMLIASR